MLTGLSTKNCKSDENECCNGGYLEIKWSVPLIRKMIETKQKRRGGGVVWSIEQKFEQNYIYRDNIGNKAQQDY